MEINPIKPSMPSGSDKKRIDGTRKEGGRKHKKEERPTCPFCAKDPCECAQTLEDYDQELGSQTDRTA